MAFPGSDFFKDAFNKFSGKYDADATARGLRSLSAGAKAAVDQASVEFPPAYVTAVISDFYAVLAGEDIAKGISAAVQSLDEAKIKKALDKAILSLDDDKKALVVAKALKTILKKLPNDKIEGAVNKAAAGQDIGKQFIVMAVLSILMPQLDMIRAGTDAEAVTVIRSFARLIPTEVIAAQLAAVATNISPEAVAAQTQKLPGQLPAPATLAKIAQDAAATASTSFDAASKGADVKAIAAILAKLPGKAVNEAIDTIKKEKAARPATPKKRPGKPNGKPHGKPPGGTKK